MHDGRLYVPVSSLEVSVAGNPRYECCTSSGAVAALDAATGDVLWYHRVIPGYPEETGQNGAGTTTWGPSGAAVWSSPTIDPARGLLYAGTGENLTHPTTESSDAILALDLETGELAWSFQATAGDAFNMACTQATNRDNCPNPPGPDLDFGMAPMLVTRPDGKEILVAGQKSGDVWALDPDNDGALLWSTAVGKGSALGGIHWGMATDGRYAYAPNADRNAVIVDVNPDRELSPGLYALDLMTGEVVWRATMPEEACEGRRRCYSSNSAGVTSIDGVVFAGGLDGFIRAHSAEDGRVIWEFDTTQPVDDGGRCARPRRRDRRSRSRGRRRHALRQQRLRHLRPDARQPAAGIRGERSWWSGQLTGERTARRTSFQAGPTGPGPRAPTHCQS